MYRTNYVEVDAVAIAHNVRAFRQWVSPGVQLMAVVKADGYGHGARTVARSALEGGADWLAVATTEEGEALRQAGIMAPLLVLGNVEPNAADAVVRWGLAQTVCDRGGIEVLARAATARGVRVPVHLKLDTGMGRLGVRTAQETLSLAQAIVEEKTLRLAGVMTHFACADDEDPGHAMAQNALFMDRLRMLREAGIDPGLCHAANSAATLRFPDMHHDMVRPGIALYGAPPVGTHLPLRPAMRWVTRAAFVKELPQGANVSSGATYTAQDTMRVMTLPVGYADGYRRSLSSRALVLVRGQLAPVIGRVCMDQCMVDVTHVPGCEVGDQVVLLGDQGDACITADQLASWMGTISYEALLAPGLRVPRILRGEAP